MPSLLLLNGSPRGVRSNSLKMLSRVADGWERGGGQAPQVLHLSRRADFAKAVEGFAQHDTVLLGMPLYTDAMPALVMTYIEALAPYVGCPGNPRLAFLVQSGFFEALHSRFLERYLERLAQRLECSYAGTIVRGGAEVLFDKPEEKNERLWEQLRGLGESLAAGEKFDSDLLSEAAGVERFPRTTASIMRAVFKLPVSQSFWNKQLRENGVWNERNATPYADASPSQRTQG